MKRFTITLFLLCLYVISFAQDIRFTGVPLGINIKEFKEKLIEKGYTFNESLSNKGEGHDVYYFSGIFAGSCANLSITTTPKSKLVSAISVAFEDFTTEKTNYENIKNKYNEIKTSLKNKYPNASLNDWSNGYIINATTFKFGDCGINLTIQEHSSNKTLNLLYVDFNITNKAKKEFEEDY